MHIFWLGVSIQLGEGQEEGADTLKAPQAQSKGNGSALEAGAALPWRCPTRSGASLWFWDQLPRGGGRLGRTEATPSLLFRPQGLLSAPSPHAGTELAPMADGRMKGYLDQQVPYTAAQKLPGNGTLDGRLLMAARRKAMDPGVPQVPDSEDLFHDLNQFQEVWLTEDLNICSLVSGLSKLRNMNHAIVLVFAYERNLARGSFFFPVKTFF
ncbi:UNVERIFIED_CONTAM: hypothetical protein K2H54_024599 [Gekko kuhli]